MAWQLPSSHVPDQNLRVFAWVLMLIFIFGLDSWGWSLCLHSLVLTHWHGKRLCSNTSRLYVFRPLLIALYADQGVHSKLCHISSLLWLLLSTGLSSRHLHEYVVSQLTRYTRRAYLDLLSLSHFQFLLVKISDWPETHTNQEINFRLANMQAFPNPFSI